MVVGQFLNQNPIHAEESGHAILPTGVEVKERDSDGARSGADSWVVVSQVRVPDCVEGESDLRLRQVASSRGLSGRGREKS